IVILAWIFVSRVAQKRSSTAQSSIYNKVRESLSGIWQGVVSLRNVRNIPLFVFYTVAIWGCYFLHYYLTFFCFDAMKSLSVGCAMATFIVGSFAIIVPTPNGAGPWHFAVKTMLILYGVGETDALYFVLIVHSIQTLLVVFLGVFSWIALAFSRSEERGARNEERGTRSEEGLIIKQQTHKK
ncbi:MAG: flippase-like domain-containing protein, partial [Prevotella sp.]|nr:flippase-like domain-containing protein [Prevotella sp.]